MTRAVLHCDVGRHPLSHGSAVSDRVFARRSVTRTRCIGKHTAVDSDGRQQGYLRSMP